VIVAAESKRREGSAVVASAIVELFGSGDSSSVAAEVRSVRTPVSLEALDEVFVDAYPLNDNRQFVIDRPMPTSTGGALALDSMLAEMGLEPVGSKKKWRIHNV
jgi:hypothetical protein